MISLAMANYNWTIEALFQADNWLFDLRVNDYQLVNFIWNIFLIAVPYYIYKYVDFLIFKSKHSHVFKIIMGVIGGGLWLLFIPNTAYVITDIRHVATDCTLATLNRICVQSSWFIPIFFTYSLIGWISFVYLLRQAKDLLSRTFGEKHIGFFIPLLMPLISLGLLLGLLQRLNSWEALIFPIEVAKTSSVYFFDANYILNWLIYTVFLYIMFWGGDHLFKDKK